MEIYTKKKNGVVVLNIVGDINIDASDLIEVIGWHVRNNRVDILCNLANVDLIDHEGFSVLNIAYKNVMNHQGRMKLCKVPMHIRNLLNAVCLDAVYEIYDTEEMALRTFKEDKEIEKIQRKPFRRRFNRISLDLPVEYKSRYSRKDDFHLGKVFDLSAVGAFIFADKTYPVGEEVALHITLLPKPGMIELQGIVLWLADKDTQPQLYPGMGIEFVGIDSAKQKKILTYIERNAPSRRNI